MWSDWAKGILWKLLQTITGLLFVVVLLCLPFYAIQRYGLIPTIIVFLLVCVAGSSLSSLLGGWREENRYYLIIAEPLEGVYASFTRFMSDERFGVLMEKKPKVGWLRSKRRDECRWYNLYGLPGRVTIVAEVVQQKDERDRIDLDVGDEVGRFSSGMSTPVYYIASEHSDERCEMYKHGVLKKGLSFDTHGPGITLEEDGDIVTDPEIIRRVWHHHKDYLKELNAPLELEFASVGRSIKQAAEKRTVIFQKRT